MTTSRRFDRLETERLVLRRWRESDREPFAELNADPETMRFFPTTLDREASDALIQQLEERLDRQGFGFWAMEVVETGVFVGFAGLNRLPVGVPGGGGLEVGWRLARHAWHHGYATEAARAALDVAFGGLGLSEVWSHAAVVNEPSLAVMRRLGLTETARFDHPSIPPGDPLRPRVAYRATRPASTPPEPGGQPSSDAPPLRGPGGSCSTPAGSYRSPGDRRVDWIGCPPGMSLS